MRKQRQGGLAKSVQSPLVDGNLGRLRLLARDDDTHERTIKISGEFSKTIFF